MRLTVLSAFVVQLALGNLCMMPMAMAEEMPDMAGMHHDMASDESTKNQSPQGIPCDGEHCFIHSLPTGVSSITTPDIVVTAPTTPQMVISSFTNEPPSPVSTAPPGQYIHVRTIVLRY